jgi:hypothetical protein
MIGRWGIPVAAGLVVSGAGGIALLRRRLLSV